MNVMNFFLYSPFGNALFHIILGILAGIIIFPNFKKKIHIILLTAVVMEFITDGAHLINGNLTHNLIFMMQLPLLILFLGYTFNKRGLVHISFLMLGNSISHMFSDTVWEGGTITPLYPFTSQTYGWNYSLSIGGISGASLAFFILLALLFTMRIAEEIMEKRERKIIRSPGLPPAPTGRRGGDTVFPPS